MSQSRVQLVFSFLVCFGGFGGLITGCDQTSSTESPSLQQESLELTEEDFLEHGRLSPYAYHKSSLSYPDFYDKQTRWTGEFDLDCEGTEGEEAFACAEQRFWQALQFDIEDRPDAIESLGKLITRLESNQLIEDELLAILYWRRAQLATAYITEEELVVAGDYSNEKLLSYAPALTQDMGKGLELSPNNLRIDSWLKTNQLFAGVLVGAEISDLAEDIIALYDEDPTFVIASAGPPLITMPLSSGWPDRIADMLLEVDADFLASSCNGMCELPAPIFAPHALEGQDYSTAEMMARVGRRDRAMYYLERSLSRPTAETWPYRSYAEDAMANFDGFMSVYKERGDDETVIDLMKINGKYACRICHTNP